MFLELLKLVQKVVLSRVLAAAVLDAWQLANITHAPQLCAATPARQPASGKLKQGSICGDHAAAETWRRRRLGGGGKPCSQITHPLQCFRDLVL